ncbi:hypothetical protein [Parasutterella sp.]|uniref:hypothetical protein n=1 Tax=Parasutterella sp. TaxID=2049037 RepID=UPI003AF9D3BF
MVFSLLFRGKTVSSNVAGATVNNKPILCVSGVCSNCKRETKSHSKKLFLHVQSFAFIEY